MRIKDVDKKRGIVTGYFAAFNNVDGDGDIIRPGAFVDTIRESGPKSANPRIKHLLNHNSGMPIGVLTELKEDTTGLYYESKVGSHAIGQDFIKMVESGLITEHSIGFNTLQKNDLQTHSDYMRNPKGGRQELLKLKLWEGSSLTAWGANQKTPLTGLKNISAYEIQKQMTGLQSFCKNSSASDETIQYLAYELKQFEQLYQKTTAPRSFTQLSKKEEEEAAIAMALLNIKLKLL